MINSIDKLCERYKDALSMVMCFIYVVTQDGGLEYEVDEVIALCEFFAEAETIIFNNLYSSKYFAQEIMEYITALFLGGIINSRRDNDKILFVVENENAIKEALDYMSKKLNKVDGESFKDFLVKNFVKEEYWIDRFQGVN